MPPKNSARDKNSKLTDFFVQAPSGLVLASARSSSTAGIAPATTCRKLPTRTSRSSIDCDLSMNLSTPHQTRRISMMSTHKHARSPEAINSALIFPPAKRKSSRKPVRMSRSDSHRMRQSDAVYGHSDNLIMSPSDSSRQIVYSSQSDEAELVLPAPTPRDMKQVVEGVHEWRCKTVKSSRPPKSPASDDAIEVHPCSGFTTHSSPTASPRSASPHCDATMRSVEMSGSSATIHESVASAYSASLVTDEFPPLPSTPEPINPETKTARLIAEIKARAFATTESSDDEHPLAYRDLEDSDDGDIIDDLPLTGGKEEKSSLCSAQQTANGICSSPLSSAPSTSNFDGTTTSPCTRRTQHYLPSSKPMRMSTRIYQPASVHLPVIIAQPSTGGKKFASSSNRKKLHPSNPVYALLREKQLEDKRGTSCAALRLAEEAINRGSRETSFRSDDELDTIDQLRLTDEQAAWKAVHESRKSTSPVDPDDAQDFTIGERESKMLGAHAGQAINKILAGNKDSKGKYQDSGQEVAPGIVFWSQLLDEDMAVDFVEIPPLSGHPILTCLDGILRSGNDSLLDLILRDGVLAVVPRDVLASNMHQLLTTALFASSQVCDTVCIALRDLWRSNSHKVQIPMAAILFALGKLGANSSFLKQLGLMTEFNEKNHIDHETLLEAIKRLLMIVNDASFAGALFCDDVPDVLLILIMMGLDPLTPNQLRMQLNVTIDTICNQVTTDALLSNIHEKVLGFVRQLTPCNKALAVSFFASGGSRARHIARRLAYCLLDSTFVIPNAPPLEPLILLLSPRAKSGELFDVANGSMDYEELGQYVYILSVALADITPYVEEERTLTKSASATSMHGSPNKPKKPLEYIHGALVALQSKIVDTRAAHLDRSRTRAAIHRLSMCIYYERMALMDARPCQRSSTLKAYFSPQRR